MFPPTDLVTGVGQPLHTLVYLGALLCFEGLVLSKEYSSAYATRAPVPYGLHP